MNGRPKAESLPAYGSANFSTLSSAKNQRMNLLGRFGRKSLARKQTEKEAAEFVQTTFGALLARKADAHSLRHWIGFIRSGGGVDKMIELIGDSAEFRRRSAHASPSKRQQNDVVALLEEACQRPEAERDVAILGNCMARQIASVLQAVIWAQSRPFWLFTAPTLWDALADGSIDLTDIFRAHKTVWIQNWLWDLIAPRYQQYRSKILLFPPMRFYAYHPDMVQLGGGDPHVVIDGPAEGCHSIIGTLAWKAGLSPADAVDLFRDDVHMRLNQYLWWETSKTQVIEHGRSCDLDLEPMLARWTQTDCFMHTLNHAKLFVVADIVRAILEKTDTPIRPGRPERFAHDYFATSIVWPV